MPIYEYRCLKCGHEMEVVQKLSDPPLQRCRECRGKVEKMISRSSFHLKGGGWYAQGYGGSGKGDSGKVDSGKGDSGKSSSKGTKDGGKSGSSDGGKSGGPTKKEAAGG